MESIGIRQAKAQLSRLVRRVERGETVTLTDRGRPIARIVPIGELDKTPEARIEELKKRGWIEDQTAATLPLPSLDVAPELTQRYLGEDRDRVE